MALSVLENHDWGTMRTASGTQYFASIANASFTNTNTYLLLARAALGGVNNGLRYNRVWTKPTAAGTAANWGTYECDATASGQGHTAAFMDLVTAAVSGTEDPFAIGGASDSQMSDSSVVAVDLSTLTLNTHYWWNEDAANDALTASAYEDHATITFTPAVGSNYLIIANFKIDDAGSGNVICAIRDTATLISPAIQSEGEDSSDYRQHLMIAVLAGDGASHTINASMNLASGVSRHDATRLFIVNLTHIGGTFTDSNDSSVNTGSAWNGVASVTGVGGDCLILGMLAGEQASAMTRIQVDGVSDPGDPVAMETMWNAATDVWAQPIFTLATVTSTVDLDVYPSADNKTFTDGTIVVIPLSGSFPSTGGGAGGTGQNTAFGSFGRIGMTGQL